MCQEYTASLAAPSLTNLLGRDYTVACGEDGVAAMQLPQCNSTNGRTCGADCQSQASECRSMAASVGSSRNIGAAKPSPRKFPHVRVPITNARCSLEGIVTKKGDKLGDRKIRSVTPKSADKIYEIILAGPRRRAPRQAEKAVALCRRAWRVIHRLYPGEFDRDVPNPWDGVTIKRRTKAKKPAVTRDRVYRFAAGAIEHGKPKLRRRR